MIINSNRIPMIKSTLISSKIVCNFGIDNRNLSETMGIVSRFRSLAISRKLSTSYQHCYTQNVDNGTGKISDF